MVNVITQLANERQGEMLSIGGLKRELGDVMTAGAVEECIWDALNANQICLVRWTGIPGMQPEGSFFDGDRWYNGLMAREAR